MIKQDFHPSPGSTGCGYCRSAGSVHGHQGAEVLEGVRVKRVLVTGDGVSVHSDGIEWQGKLLVGADGASSIVARALRLAAKKRFAVLLENHIPVSPENEGKAGA